LETAKKSYLFIQQQLADFSAPWTDFSVTFIRLSATYFAKGIKRRKSDVLHASNTLGCLQPNRRTVGRSSRS
jgi:hypothetical protein